MMAVDEEQQLVNIKVKGIKIEIIIQFKYLGEFLKRVDNKSLT